MPMATGTAARSDPRVADGSNSGAISCLGTRQRTVVRHIEQWIERRDFNPVDRSVKSRAKDLSQPADPNQVRNLPGAPGPGSTTPQTQSFGTTGAVNSPLLPNSNGIGQMTLPATSTRSADVRGGRVAA
jgi:hypothetical protein